MVGLKSLAMLPRYFDYIIIMYLKQKAHLTPELSPNFFFFFSFRLEPGPKSPARVTTLIPFGVKA